MNVDHDLERKKYAQINAKQKITFMQAEKNAKRKFLLKQTTTNQHFRIF